LESKLLLILIPVYKEVEKLSSLEKKSIKNTLLKFKESHSVGLLKSSLIINKSYNDFFEYQFLDFEFPFSTWGEYNALLKDVYFYKNLYPYKYLLIVQTDAYVFSTDLSEFYQYDYVGAPWERNSLKYINGRVGNGGFSLRNIETVTSVLQSKKRMFSFRSLLHLNFKYTYKFGSMQRLNGFKKFTTYQIITLFSKSFYQFISANSFRNAYLFESLMEDTLYGVLVPNKFSSFIIPDVEIAVKFSMDENPLFFYQMNNNRLPLGCHAFIKNYKIFWFKYIN
jgi:hypothetical protein